MTVTFVWRDAEQVTLDEAGRLAFPELPMLPGAYRFRLVGPSRVSTYIGEGSNLRLRAGLYRVGASGQPTNHRMNTRMRSHLGDGGRIEMSILTEAEIVVDGRRTSLDLGRKASRVLIEAAAIHAVPGSESLENLPGIGDSPISAE